MCTQSVNKAKRLWAVTTSETKLKIIADFEVGKQVSIIGRELVVRPTSGLTQLFAFQEDK
jgi:hypothetical protein